MKFNSSKKARDSIIMGAIFFVTICLINVFLFGDAFHQVWRSALASTVYFMILWYFFSDKVDKMEKRVHDWFEQKHSNQSK